MPQRYFYIKLVPTGHLFAVTPTPISPSVATSFILHLTLWPTLSVMEHLNSKTSTPVIATFTKLIALNVLASDR